jgi:hypothetical protein
MEDPLCGAARSVALMDGCLIKKERNLAEDFTPNKVTLNRRFTRVA